MRLFDVENLVLPRMAGSSMGQSKIPLCGGQSSMALTVCIGCKAKAVRLRAWSIEHGAWSF